MFTAEQKKAASFILKNQESKLSELNSTELRELAIAWSYYSGKIEGNTYTYVETEALLKDGITSPKRYEDAKMLKNLHNTFTRVLEDIKKGKKYELNEVTLFSLHSPLISDLIDDTEKGKIRSRAVRITGTNYIPPKNPTEINEKLNEVFYKVNQYKSPLERGIFVHCNLAKIQPFVDGNKRTARLIESIVLMQDNLVPVFSSKGEDILKYREAIVNFYETGKYNLYADFVLSKHIERIKSISQNMDDLEKKKPETKAKGLSM